MMEHITKLIYLASIWSCQLKPRINFSNCLKLLPHSSFFGSYFLPVCRARTWHAVRVHLCVSHWKEATLRCPISFWLKFQHTSAWYSTGAFCSNKTLKNKTRRMRNFCNLSLCENLSVTLPRCYAVFLSLSPGTPHKHMQNKRQDVGEKLIEINKKTERNLKKKKKKSISSCSISSHIYRFLTPACALQKQMQRTTQRTNSRGNLNPRKAVVITQHNNAGNGTGHHINPAF